MTKYKKSRLQGIALNIVVLLVCFILVQTNMLGMVPMVIMAFSAIAIFGYAMGYFFNYDDEEVSLDNTGKTMAQSSVDGLSEFGKKK